MKDYHFKIVTVYWTNTIFILDKTGFCLCCCYFLDSDPTIHSDEKKGVIKIPESEYNMITQISKKYSKFKKMPLKQKMYILSFVKERLSYKLPTDILYSIPV